MPLPVCLIPKEKVKTFTKLWKISRKNILAIDPEIAKELGNKIPLNLEIPKSTYRQKANR